MRRYMWPNSCLPSATVLIDAAYAASRGRFTLEGVENHAPRTCVFLSLCPSFLTFSLPPSALPHFPPLFASFRACLHSRARRPAPPCGLLFRWPPFAASRFRSCRAGARIVSFPPFPPRGDPRPDVPPDPTSRCAVRTARTLNARPYFNSTRSRSFNALRRTRAPDTSHLAQPRTPKRMPNCAQSTQITRGR